jgi:DNA polymerase I
MKVIKTTERGTLSKFEEEQCYNLLDCCITHEVDSVLESHMDEIARKTYNFSLRCQRPATLMMLRGVKVNPIKRQEMIEELQKELLSLETWLDEMAQAIWDKPLNARSPKQLIDFFYHRMKVKAVTKKDKQGEAKPTTDREALEKIIERSKITTPIVNTIFSIRDCSKTLGVLRSEIRKGRFHTSYNVAGTSTGRWSSKKDPFDTGSNSQNITKDIREIFIADPGYMLGACDLSQAESRAVAYLSQDEDYIKACESGDLHTYCCTLLWPQFPWSGILKQDKAKAEELYFRHFSRRDLSKRAGHLSNYYGQAVTLSQRLKLPLQLSKNFQRIYFSRFPKIPLWHKEVAQRIVRDRQITTVLGRRRHIYERLESDETLRAMIAFEPQSIIADIINEGICKVVEILDTKKNIFVNLQVHDCLVFHFPEGDFELAKEVQKTLEVPVEIYGRTMKIPTDLKVGYDWKNMVEIPYAKDLKRQTYNLLDLPIESQTR